MKTFKSKVIALVMGLSTVSALAADYPTKNLQGIIQWGAGGATDNVSRVITPLAESHLGKKIVLTNRPGGAGAIATAFVNSRPADGYTLMYGAETVQLHRVLGLGNVDYADFYPVSILLQGTSVIVTNNRTSWDNVDEMLTDIKANPGKFKAGTTGTGGLPFMVNAMLQDTVGIEVISIPFDGDGPGMTALQGGHVDLMVLGLAAAIEHIRAGRLKALAVVAEEPLPNLPGVPAITDSIPELGKYLPWGPFYGVFVKKDTPDEIKAKLTEAFRLAAEDELFGQFAERFQSVRLNLSGDEAEAYLAHWQSVSSWLLQEIGEAKVSPETLGIPKP
ncbi:Bug family tripartite tricarboxylate transporter substrate binding protein [Zobellella iuensis]|jgi:tripartite-type tricarboxylate transporter receptor subunit TctC|uniref:Tripartite tricarboxylate transporter substrate binding protein n=1 Tax=Zobellella iuensis TaxID=2803811 RepID=A0ABS1QM50_9GAMM|nr:tripartite tricarboxylate transporter substrate binding protein [Zobellella iuensis]MBL1375876.1 tripartite tricarboxylate transporter substrate binding protein [Zobellella iuensis]